MAIYIGLMSGTSADGIDAALVEINDKAPPQLLNSHFKPTGSALRQEILDLYQPGENEIERLGTLDVVLGEQFATTCLELIEKAGLSPADIKAIGSHGQTIRHRPRASTPFTLQIGDPNTIASLTKITTIADFRRKDVALGGQGAPLAPAFHQAVFATANQRRGVLNLGGIANLTVLDGADLSLGYDIGPANGLMDYWYQKHHQGAFDRDGSWALSGKPNEALLKTLLSHSFFNLPPPKSTGREEFSGDWLESQLHQQERIESHDVQATLLEFSSQTIAQAIDNHNLQEIFVCGGGAHNQAFVNRIQHYTPGTHIAQTDLLGIPVDHVESMTFAWLAHQTLHNRINNNPAVTGASRHTILGGIYLGH